ncbi:uncharacterized protein MYCFIDRAFT_83527 [Pseudocercospora fijiensis CIRAD86]|uniref:BTB domain-containing protein n=1 Tax=Pseudocercospora fijiensis (strain CIRAD86) TaxID=383855 RepID=M2ZT91_PSEFD|nr:uncharacterized protein MYCFIDRAFT_83527 [Pseudocercospora fijiensis CIRAD86]EME82229.1 hypothetical protein MYCFIDRAFT_83527 [Pseudocercospora fijiensis CIRAD86]
MAATNCKKRSFDDFSESTVTILVGSDQVPFYVHPGILASKSKYFKAMFAAAWTGAQAKICGLPDDETEPDTFRRYCCWVYKDVVEMTMIDSSDAQDKTGGARFEILFKLYILADQLGDKVLRNMAVDRIAEVEKATSYRPGHELINLAYEKTAGKNMLCKFLVDDALSGTEPEWFRTVFEELPPAFVQELSIGWAKASWDKSVNHKRPQDVGKCTYHEHGEDAPKDESCTEDEPSKNPATIPKTPSKKRR